MSNPYSQRTSLIHGNDAFGFMSCLRVVLLFMRTDIIIVKPIGKHLYISPNCFNFVNRTKWLEMTHRALQVGFIPLFSNIK